MTDEISNKKFSGKVAVVTGAANGIGEQYARRLSAEGAALVLADIAREAGEAVAASIVESGGRAIFHQLDITDEQACLAMARRAEAEFGRIDYLVNNAAIFAGMKTVPLMSVDMDYFRRFLDVNLTGALIVTRAVAPIIAASGGGAIVNQSSTAAYGISGSGGYYGISKLALNGLTMALASELGPQGIRVNSLAPGATETAALGQALSEDMKATLIQSLAIKRLATPDDQADALLFLLSDQASFITGQVLCVDGGRTRRL